MEEGRRQEGRTKEGREVRWKVNEGEGEGWRRTWDMQVVEPIVRVQEPEDLGRTEGVTGGDKREEHLERRVFGGEVLGFVTLDNPPFLLPSFPSTFSLPPLDSLKTFPLSLTCCFGAYVEPPTADSRSFIHERGLVYGRG